MARKETVVAGFMEKWASGDFLYRNLIQRPRIALKQMARGYAKTNNSPVFKAKKYLGRAVLGTAAVGYGLHQITKAPKSEEMPYNYQPPHM